ncbi:MAG: hypothetical protein ACQESE_01285 [Nanobdellota archaeon]
MSRERFEARIDFALTSYLNSLVSRFIFTAHDYFNESFLDDFRWNKNFDEIKFLVKNQTGKAYISQEGSLVLGADKYFRGYHDVSNFSEKQITGFGILNFFHEISHCYLRYKKSTDQNPIQLPRLEYSLTEGFCDINAHRMSEDYSEATEAINFEKEILSELVNRAKYSDYYFQQSCNDYLIEDLISSENDAFKIAVDEAELFGYTSRAIAYSKFEQFTSPKEMFVLFDKFKTFNELRYYIPELV